jgi:hypothetical protein
MKENTIELKKLAGKFNAWQNCINGKNVEWEEKHYDAIIEMCKELPSGSGLDAGVKFNFEESKPERLVFNFGYHHMNEGGFYDGWTEHQLIITPSLQFGYNMRITGKDRNFIKEYLTDLFSNIFN